MLVSIIIDKWYLWGVQGFQVRGRLGVILARNGHFCLKTVKLLLLPEVEWNDHESWSVLSLTNGTSRVFRNLRSKVI